MKKVSLTVHQEDWRLAEFSFIAGPVTESILYQIDSVPYVATGKGDDGGQASSVGEWAVLSVDFTLELMRALEPANEDHAAVKGSRFELQRSIIVAALESANKPGVSVSVVMSDF